MNNQTNVRVKTVLVLAFAFLLGNFISNTVFVASTPIIRKDFIASVRNIPSTLMKASKNTIAFLTTIGKNSLTNKETAQVNTNNPNPTAKNNDVYTNFLKNQTTVSPPPQVPFKSISTGVYAADDPVTNTRYLKLSSGVQLQIKTIKIKAADGTEQELKALVPLSQ